MHTSNCEWRTASLTARVLLKAVLLLALLDSAAFMPLTGYVSVPALRYVLTLARSSPVSSRSPSPPPSATMQRRRSQRMHRCTQRWGGHDSEALCSSSSSSAPSRYVTTIPSLPSSNH